MNSKDNFIDSYINSWKDKKKTKFTLCIDEYFKKYFNNININKDEITNFFNIISNVDDDENIQRYNHTIRYILSYQHINNFTKILNMFLVYIIKIYNENKNNITFLKFKIQFKIFIGNIYNEITDNDLLDLYTDIGVYKSIVKKCSNLLKLIFADDILLLEPAIIKCYKDRYFNNKINILCNIIYLNDDFKILNIDEELLPEMNILHNVLNYNNSNILRNFMFDNVNFIQLKDYEFKYLIDKNIITHSEYKIYDNISFMIYTYLHNVKMHLDNSINKKHNTKQVVPESYVNNDITTIINKIYNKLSIITGITIDIVMCHIMNGLIIFYLNENNKTHIFKIIQKVIEILLVSNNIRNNMCFNSFIYTYQKKIEEIYYDPFISNDIYKIYVKIYNENIKYSKFFSDNPIKLSFIQMIKRYIKLLSM